jgi:hypothetical protein
MALRMHDYCGRQLRHWHEVHPHSPWLPEITSLVVYARQGPAWSAPLRLEEFYRGPAWAADLQHPGRSAPRLEYLLDDLSTQSEQQVLERPGPALVPLCLLVLRFAGTEELALRLPHWRELFSRVYTSPHGPQALYRITRYLQKLGDERAYEATKGVLHSLMETERAEAFMRTMEEVLKERGRQLGLAEGEARGLAKGLAEGLAKAVLRLLEARGVHVDDSSRLRIQSCMDVDTLELWHERALRATRLSELWDGPAP